MPRPGALALLLLLLATSGLLADDKPIRPIEPIELFNKKDLSGLHVWLRDTKDKDPKGVFAVENGVIHVSGDGYGYAATDKAYRDYRVVVEYKWGQKTNGGKYVRNSGLLLNGVGPDGGAGNGAWMACIECQLAQGCVGDLIPIRGKDEKQEVIPVRFTADTALGTDKRPRWKTGGEKRDFIGRQLWWNLHEAGFQELLDTRGKDDLESPLGDWTRVECTCDGGKIAVFVNGRKVNECYDAFPSAGKILLQCEGYEVYFRKFELHPLKK